jgi:hypothetical protein
MPLSDRFTDLLSAWSAFGGAVGSILAVIVAGALLYHEMKARRVERREAEANQARRVTTVIEPQAAINGKIWGLTVSFTNHSDAQVTEVELTGTNRQLRETITNRRSVVRAGEPFSFGWELPTPIAGDVSDMLFGVWFESVAIFTDANGQRWQRRNWESPTRWPPPGPSRRRRLRWWFNRRKQAVRDAARRMWGR